MLFASLATAAALFALVSVNVLLGQSGMKQAEVKRRISAKLDRLEQVQVDVAKLSSLDRIGTAAKKLGLVRAPKIVFLTAPSASPSPGISPAAPSTSGPARPEANASPGRGGR